jgi:hypothetical protein
MKSKLIRLADDDHKARDLIRDNFEVGAYDHTLSRKLRDRFPTAAGRMIVIVADWVDLDQLAAYSHGSTSPVGEYANGDRPTERLVAFVEEHLGTSKDAVAVCEHSGATRKTYENWQWGPLPPISCYGDEEVYHILRPGIDSELIEDAIRLSQGRWGTTGVCTTCEYVPEGDIPDEEFFDTIVQNTKHIIMPAFDGDGVLIWSPTLPSGTENGSGD